MRNEAHIVKSCCKDKYLLRVEGLASVISSLKPLILCCKGTKKGKDMLFGV